MTKPLLSMTGPAATTITHTPVVGSDTGYGVTVRWVPSAFNYYQFQLDGKLADF